MLDDYLPPSASSSEGSDMNGYEDPNYMGEGQGDLAYATMFNTFYETWEEFCIWDASDCAEHLAALAVPSDSALYDKCDYAFEPDPDALAFYDSDHGIGEPVDYFTICEYDSLGQLTKHSLPVKTGDAGRRSTRMRNAWFLEHAQYEACTPSNASAYIDTPKVEVCQYIKYGDNPQFNAREYLKQFKAVAWQDQGHCNPDQWLILARTIAKLSSWAKENDPSSLHIFIARVFPEVEDIPFVLDRAKQRDPIAWPSPHFIQELDQLSRLWRSDVDPPGLARVFYSFCPQMSCIQFECLTHPYPAGWLSGRMGNSTLDNDTLKQMYGPRRPCGEDCFLSRASDDVSVGCENTETILLLDDMLAADPDALPCHMSQILLHDIPCYKIFARRSEKVLVDKNDKRPRPVPLKWNDFDDLSNYSMSVRCDHEGRCSSKTCECFRKGVHCQRNCLCDDACALRYDGCDCSASQNAHATVCSRDFKERLCSCVQWSWECSPELCGHTMNRKKRPMLLDRAATVSCRNVDLQFKSGVPIEVKTGMYGLGAFAKRQIRKGEFIGEYSAEIFMNRRVYVESTTLLHNFTGYNYSFKLNEEVVADAASVGNEMRFFNHSEKDSNIEPRIKLVNSDHRIAFYAIRKIKKGEELLFDYGRDYWKDQ